MSDFASPRTFDRYVAIGDSFTEGVGDEPLDGAPRGWADLVAGVLSQDWIARDPAGERTGYANLAIRGQLLGPIIDEQLDPALALRPDLVTFAGGGNDMLRPRAVLPALLRLVDLTVARLTDSGATVVIFTGADPCDGLPFGARIRATGDKLSAGVRRIAEKRGAVLVDLWPLTELRDPRYWAVDRLHLNAIGHQQVAARVLDKLRVERPAEWSAPVGTPERRARTARDELDFYWEYVGPWVRRRLTGTSSGDHRPPKRPVLAPLEPASPAVGIHRAEITGT
ncbi:Lysophospholipase L1 [Nakamurella panacisegetis]|uniref:Lysophospholipase L1 n=1 Tax=Nakamurella panacisegetis TaxID=1090615 RepID=A0A1H0I6I9_9ACTN|nr:SGNH/GDSL hydrolase family protein [Nakamurella panacisegetis]SDO26820.1 Lysophospholipase L1 [Nakamurella panacisegetis]